MEDKTTIINGLGGTNLSSTSSSSLSTRPTHGMLAPAGHFNKKKPRSLTLDDMVFTYQLNPGMFIQTPGAVDTLERILDAADDPLDDTAPNWWEV
jgi:hypothetical protein